eukprot:3430077-Pyramimonas_sp.AAC.1
MSRPSEDMLAYTCSCARPHEAGLPLTETQLRQAALGKTGPSPPAVPPAQNHPTGCAHRSETGRPP